MSGHDAAEGVFEEILEEVKRRTELRADERSVERVIAALLKTSDFWEVVSESEEPLPLVSAILDVLEEKGIVEKSEGGMNLTDFGMKFAEEYAVSYHKCVCACCSGRTVNLEDFKDLLKRFEDLAKRRPAPVSRYDQGFVTTETTVARLAFMHSRGDVAGKNILLLGDDDLLSVAMMLSGLPKSISVLEIDERLTKFIKSVADELNFDSLYVLERDLRDELPEELRGRFDTFFTDPTETLTALRVFLGRGIAALKKPRSAGYFGLTRIESSLRKWYLLQKMLTQDFKVVLTDILKDFNEYENWGYEEETRAFKLAPVKEPPKSRWYRSYLIRFETLEDSEGFEERSDAGADFYSDEESSTI